MSKKLYEITKAFVEIEKIYDQLSPEDKERAEEFLNSLQVPLKEKAHNISVLLGEWGGTKKMIDDEIKRLSARKKRLEKQEKWLKDYLLYNMIELDLNKIDTGIFTISVRNNPPKIEVVNEEDVSQDFMKEKITYSVDKAKAKKEYNDTGILPAGFIMTDSKRIDIK